MLDHQSWAIRELVVKTGHRFSGKEVRIPASQVDRISYEDSTVFVNLTREAVEQSPPHLLAPAGPGERAGPAHSPFTKHTIRMAAQPFTG